MERRVLTLFLLVYLSLDSGNPFMPGVVTFVDGRLEVVDAGRPPGPELPEPASAGEPCPAYAEPARSRPLPRAPAVQPAPRRRWIPAHHAGAVSPAPPRSGDDH
jgi:hypothetical protein